MRTEIKNNTMVLLFLIVTTLCLLVYNIMPIVELFKNGISLCAVCNVIAKWILSPFVMLATFILAQKGARYD